MPGRWLLVLAVALGGCAEPASPAPPEPPALAPAPPPAPPEPPRDAWLAVLRADGLAVLDADALDAPPRDALASLGTERILDATATRRFLLLDHSDEARRRVVFTDADGARVLAEDGDGASFLTDGRPVVQRHRSAFSCGGATREPFLELRERADARARQIPGRLWGPGVDGRSLLLEHPVVGRCRPMGGRDFAAPLYSLVDLTDAVVSRPASGDEVAVGIRTSVGQVATIDVRGASGLGGSCILHVAGTTHSLYGTDCVGDGPAVSWDGRWVAIRAMAEGGAVELQVLRATDGRVVARHDAGRPLGTVGTSVAEAGACFSPDGSRLVIARADTEIVLTEPEGGASRSLGRGGCVGFSPDGRHLLLTGTGGRTSFRVVRMADGAATELPDALDARFLPGGAP